MNEENNHETKRMAIHEALTKFEGNPFDDESRRKYALQLSQQFQESIEFIMEEWDRKTVADDKEDLEFVKELNERPNVKMWLKAQRAKHPNATFSRN